MILYQTGCYFTMSNSQEDSLIYKNNCNTVRHMRVGWKVHMMALYLLLSTFFYQWDPSTATLTEEVYGPQGGLCWKINLIWSHSMTVSRSAYELFSWSLYVHNLITSMKVLKFMQKAHFIGWSSSPNSLLVLNSKLSLFKPGDQLRLEWSVCTAILPISEEGFVQTDVCIYLTSLPQAGCNTRSIF